MVILKITRSTKAASEGTKAYPLPPEMGDTILDTSPSISTLWDLAHLIVNQRAFQAFPTQPSHSPY